MWQVRNVVFIWMNSFSYNYATFPSPLFFCLVISLVRVLITIEDEEIKVLEMKGDEMNGSL